MRPSTCRSRTFYYRNMTTNSNASALDFLALLKIAAAVIRINRNKRYIVEESQTTDRCLPFNSCTVVGETQIDYAILIVYRLLFGRSICLKRSSNYGTRLLVREARFFSNFRIPCIFAFFCFMLESVCDHLRLRTSSLKNCFNAVSINVQLQKRRQHLVPH